MAAAKRLSRTDRDGARIWITGALDMIARDGVQALRVEPLARQINVSKGSFYWFFRDLDALKTEALVYWLDVLNAPVFEAIRGLDAPLGDRLARLIGLVMSERLGRYDAAIRSWALVDQVARKFVEEVDAVRMAFMEEIFVRDAKDGSRARLRAHLFYRALIAESYVRSYPTGSNRADFMKDMTTHLAT